MEILRILCSVGYDVQPVLSDASIGTPLISDQGVAPSLAPSTVPFVPSTSSSKSSLSGGAIGGIVAGAVIASILVGGSFLSLLHSSAIDPS